MNKYENVEFWREDGVVELRLHTKGGPLRWSRTAHRELGQAFGDIADDADVKTVILTGTGKDFCTEYDTGSWGAEPTPWHVIWWEGRRLLQRLVDIDVPVIGVLNGPVTVHSELVFLSDVILASDTASVADLAHFVNDVVPGDGVQLVWPYLLGPQRGKYFLLTGQTLMANELLQLGAVNEVLPASEVGSRAREIARSFAQKRQSTLRFTRAVLADPLRRLLQEGLSHGLAAEGGTSPMG
jgi:enoyl-CoA hydratase/carnithine racemase